MKFIHIAAAFFIMLLPACEESREYVTADKVFRISVPKILKKTFSPSRAALQCRSKDGSVEAAFFSYRTQDLAETAGSGTLLEIFIDEAAAEMKAFEREQQEEIYAAEGKYIRRITCKGIKKDNILYRQVFSSADFYDNPEVILIAVQSAPDGKYGQYEDVLRKTVETAKVN